MSLHLATEAVHGSCFTLEGKEVTQRSRAGFIGGWALLSGELGAIGRYWALLGVIRRYWALLGVIGRDWA